MTARKPPSGPPEPYHPVAYEDEDVYALKALNRGEASEGQQQRIMHWLIQRACMFDEMSYRPGVDGERATAFCEGRRFVGLQVLKLVHLNLELLEKTRAKKNG